MSHGPWAATPLEPVLELLVEPEALRVPELALLLLLEEPLLVPAEVLFCNTTVPAVVGLMVCGDTVNVFPFPETQYE